MKKYQFILGLTGLLWLTAACSSEDIAEAEAVVLTPEEQERSLVLEACQNSEVPINIGNPAAGGMNVTRAPLEAGEGGVFSTGTDKYLGVFCLATKAYSDVPAGGQTINWTNETYAPLTLWMLNVPAKVEGTTAVKFLDSDFSSDATYYYPLSNWYQYTFYAYYPRIENNEQNPLSITSSRVIEQYFQLDGSTDILWAKGVSTKDDEGFESREAEPFNAKYFRLRSAALSEGETIEDYYPTFQFKHVLSRFDFQVKADDGCAAGLTAKNFKIKNIYLKDALFNVGLVVARPGYLGATLNEGELELVTSTAKAPSGVVRKNLNIKANGEDYDRFDQNSDQALDNPLSGLLETEATAAGYLMVPPSSAKGFEQYTLVIEVDYEGIRDADRTITYPMPLSKFGGAIKAGTKYNIVLTFQNPQTVEARAVLTEWDNGGDVVFGKDETEDETGE